jgi:hypothetical protein
MHLSAHHIDDYLEGRLAGDGSTQAALHLSICLHCQHRAVERADDPGWNRRGLLGRLVRQSPGA